jgi:putative transposase
VSSGWLQEAFPELQQFAWQNGYGAFMVSTSQTESVRRYIANQKTHHQRQSFDEFVQLLKLHKVEFDERYWWK